MKTKRTGGASFGVALLALILAACAEEPTHPAGARDETPFDEPALALQLECRVSVLAEDLECGPGAAAGEGANLIVGGQDQFVRLLHGGVTISGETFRANVQVQNLTLQPFNTLDGVTAEPEGVRVFFIREPDNGVTIANPSGEAAFVGSRERKYFAYPPQRLSYWHVPNTLDPGHVGSPSFPWEFNLNGATDFTFSVLVWTKVPDPTAYSTTMTRLAAGHRHTCGESSDGELFCWGGNQDSGQLGNGDDVFNMDVPSRVLAPSGRALTNVAAGDRHTCADGDDGELYCWGDNFLRRLGTGSAEPNSPVPAPVVRSGIGGVKLSNPTIGEYHTCAEGGDGNVYCWGDNGSGRLGDNSTTDRELPVAVNRSEIGGVALSKPAAGHAHTCAEGADGSIYCWGNNNGGKLGDGTTINSSVPTQVEVPSPDVKLFNVTAGMDHTCAEGSNQRIYCWGLNQHGQLGTAGGQTSTPQPVVAPDGVILSRPVAGANHTCANGNNGMVYCWGSNDKGQLGDGTTDKRLVPVAVLAPEGVSLHDVIAGYLHTCAMSTTGRPYCWGDNSEGKIGNGNHSMWEHDYITTPAVVAATLSTVVE